MSFRSLCLCAAAVSSAAVCVRAAPPALERAISAELGRAKRELHDPGYPRVYHAQMTVWDLDDWDRWSATGAPRAESTMRQRIVLPDLRVGGAAMDNHPTTPRGDYFGTPVSFAEDEYALRHSFWLVLDGAYKAASADFLHKQAERVSRGKAEYDTDDLAVEPSTVSARERPASPWDLDRLRRLEDALADPLRRAPWLLYAESHVGVRRLWTRVRDTEGTAVDKDDDWAKLEIEAAALSPDGLREVSGRDWEARAPGALPSEAEAAKAGRELVADLEELRVAATTSPFSAPALLDPSAAAALVYALGQRLSGEELRNPAGAQTFRGRLGERVLSDELTLVDDPTQAAYRGKPLYGRYEFDDQGVPARRVVLVERGVLKGFLLSRYPVKGFPRSNGHGRAPVGQIPVGSPGNLFLTSAAPQPLEKLLERLRAECRRRGAPYGLWVRRLRAIAQQQGGGTQGSIRFMAAVYLVDASTGRTLRVRDLDLVGTPLVMAAGVLAAGDDAEATEVNIGAPAAVVAPSLLLSEAELQRSETKPEKAPILPPPQPPTPEAVRRTGRAAGKGALVQVDRFLLAGREELVEDFDSDGVLEWRQTRTPDGLYLDVKAAAESEPAARAALRGVDAAVARLVPGGVHKTVLVPLERLSAYRARYEDGWPDAGPR